ENGKRKSDRKEGRASEFPSAPSTSGTFIRQTASCPADTDIPDHRRAISPARVRLCRARAHRRHRRRARNGRKSVFRHCASSCRQSRQPRCRSSFTAVPQCRFALARRSTAKSGGGPPGSRFYRGERRPSRCGDQSDPRPRQKAPPRKDRLEIKEAILQVIALAQNEMANKGISVRTQLAEALLVADWR